MKRRTGGTQNIEIALATGLGVIVLLLCLAFFFKGIENIFDDNAGYKAFFTRHESFGESIEKNVNARDNAGIISIRTASSDAQQTSMLFADIQSNIASLSDTLFNTGSGGNNLSFNATGEQGQLLRDMRDETVNPNLEIIKNMSSSQGLVNHLVSNNSGGQNNFGTLLYVMSWSIQYKAIFSSISGTYFLNFQMNKENLQTLKNALLNPSDQLSSDQKNAQSFLVNMINLLLESL